MKNGKAGKQSTRAWRESGAYLVMYLWTPRFAYESSRADEDIPRSEMTRRGQQAVFKCLPEAGRFRTALG